MRLAALIGLVALTVTEGTYDMAPAQASPPALKVLDDGSPGGSVQLPLGRELEVELGTNPTTGYTWRLDLANSAGLRLKSRQYEASTSPAGPPRLGAGGIERFVFEATAPGVERLHFEYRRGSAGEPARTYDLTVTVLP
jgi:inhibitor of cysteine peptidase